MQTKFLLLFQILAFCVGISAKAQNAELFEQKSRLEKLISERIRSTITTSLDKNSFEVSATVLLKEIKKAEPKANKEPMEETPDLTIKGPEDLQMGLLNADELIKTYQKEIRDLKLARDLAKDLAANKKTDKEVFYEVKRVHVLVGLKEDLGKDYAKAFKTWLDERIASEFGKIGKASITTIYNRPEPTVSKPQKTLTDYAKDFQFTISTLLAILGLISAVVLFKTLRSKDAEENKKLQLQMSQSGMLKSLETDGLENSASKKTEVAMFADIKNMKDLTSKLTALISKSDLDLNKIVSTWLESNDDGEGVLKTVCIFDALLSTNNQFRSNKDEDNIEFLRSIIIPEAFKLQVGETLFSMKDKPTEFKIKYMESAYWDLLSFQTIGDKFLRKPFSYAAAVDPIELRTALLNQPSNVRSITILSLPQSIKRRVISEFDTHEKKEILERTIEIPDFEKSELESISEALKFQLQSKEKKEEKVSGLQLLPALLETLNAYEEITFLSDLKRRRPVYFNSIKTNWPTLAFINEWRPEHLKKFLNTCDNEELEALLSTLPESKEVILGLVSNRVREILADSTSSKRKSPKELISFLTSARQKLLDSLTKKELALNDLYLDNDVRSEWQRAG